MKKTSILFLVTVIAVFLMASCKKNEAKKSTLNNQVDSLNYALGLANGDALKNYYMSDVKNIDEAVNVFISALDKAYTTTEEPNEMYQLGMQIGGSFKRQEKDGLWGNENLKFDYSLVKQGMENAMNGTEAGMTAMEAQTYIQTTMQAIEEEKRNAANINLPSEENIVIEEAQ